MSSTLKKFYQRDQLGRYDQEAQKLSQYISNLYQNPYSQERWIWELIQNAKDVGNEFDKLKIKVVIQENKLTFTHNGFPFSPQQLNSITSQYSLKQQENSENVETTGKYGTGFISTHILSRIIRIEGKLKFLPDEVSQFQQSQSEIIQINKQEKQSQKKIVENMRKTDIKNQKIINKQKEEGFYQNISIALDRQFKNREELAQKLKRNKKQIQKELSRTDNQQPITQRSEDDFDTSFIYDKLDKQSHTIIKKGIESLEKLFPSVLLFNPKLHSIEVINLNPKLDILSYTIAKDKEDKINMINTFSVSVQKEAKNKQRKKSKGIISYAYSKDPKSKSIVAVQVEITSNRMFNLLQFDKNHPKIYKQFPLIGSEDTGFNFIFTSRDFYPNETRTQLLLNKLQHRETEKADKNWEILKAIFHNIIDLYLLISKHIVSGKFNLFIMKHDNYFANVKGRKLSEITDIYKKIEQEVKSLEIFKTQASKKCNIDKVTLIYENSFKTCNKDQINQINAKINDLFGFLYKNTTLEASQYVQFLKFSTQHRLNCNMVSLDDCLKLFQKSNFSQFVKLQGDQQNFFQMLEKMYQFLVKYPQFQHYLFSSQYKLILNELKEFKTFQQNNIIITNNMLLSQKYKDHQKYQIIAEALGIQYKNKLIHSRFRKNFEKILKQKNKTSKSKYFFGFIQMQQKIHNYFNQYNIIQKSKIGIKQNQKRILVPLGRLLSSFSYIKQGREEIFKYAAQVKQFQSITTPFLLDSKIDNSQEFFKQLMVKFVANFSTQIKTKYQNCKDLSSFIGLFKQSPNKVNKAFHVIKQLIKVQKSKTQRQKQYNTFDRLKMITWSEKFVEQSQVSYLKQPYSYLTPEDIQIHEKFHKKYHLKYNIKNLKESLVHPQLNNAELRLNSRVKQFKDHFNFLNIIYDDRETDNSDKETILNYYFQIYLDFFRNGITEIKGKYDTFVSIINNRHCEYAKLLTLNFDNDQKDFICKILTMKESFSDFEAIFNQNPKEVVALLRQKQRQEMTEKQFDKDQKAVKPKRI